MHDGRTDRAAPETALEQLGVEVSGGALSVNTPPRIAVLCDWFLRYGSAQALGLKQVGADVVLVYVDRLGEFGGMPEERKLILERLEAAGVEAVRVPPRRTRGLLGDTRRLTADLRDRGVATLIAQSHYDPRFAAAGVRWPTAIIVHDPRPHSGEERSLPRRGAAVARFAELAADCIVIHSDRLRPQVRPYLRRKIAVVPHGADPEHVSSPVPTTRKLLFVGRLHAYKGLDVALKAFSTVRRERPETQLVVAGRGPARSTFAGGIPEGVEFIDRYIAEDELESQLDSATLVLLPYVDATQSGVGLQAIARGVPCIVSDQGALPDLIPASASSCVFASGDSDALASAILRNLDHDQQFRDRFLTLTKERFAWPHVALRLLEELERLGLIGSKSALDRGAAHVGSD